MQFGQRSPKIILVWKYVKNWKGRERSKLYYISAIMLWSEIFQNKCFCLEIILAMLKITWIVDISHNWVSYVPKKLIFKKFSVGTVISSGHKMP